MAMKKVAKKMAPAPVKSVTKKVPSNGGVVRPQPTAAGPTKAPAKTVASVKKAAREEVPDDAGEENGVVAEIRSGWSASQETIDSTSTWAVAFRPTTQTQIVKILQQSPYASFRRHWINRVNGRRAYTCLQSFNRDCPLCDVGDRASAVSAFNIAVCGDDGEAVLKSWDCGVRITQTLRTFANDPKVGPLDKRSLYFAVSKTESQNRQQSQTIIAPVRERDMAEDYGVPPLDDDALARLMDKAYTNDVVQMNTHSELEQIADEVMNEDSGASGHGQGWGG